MAVCQVLGADHAAHPAMQWQLERGQQILSCCGVPGVRGASVGHGPRHHVEEATWGSCRQKEEGTGQALTWAAPYCPRGAGHWVQSPLWAVVASGTGPIEGEGRVSPGCGAGSPSLTVVASCTGSLDRETRGIRGQQQKPQSLDLSPACTGDGRGLAWSPGASWNSKEEKVGDTVDP